MPRSQTVHAKVSRTDSAWRPSPEPWGANRSVGRPIAHRLVSVATPNGGNDTHALTVCDVYLLRTAPQFEAPTDLELCDACLMDDTQFHAVYVYTAPSGESVYVGYSADLARRVQQHTRESEWWTPKLVLTYTVYDTEVLGRKAETQAIADLNPIHNVRRKSGGSKLGGPKATLHANPQVLDELVAQALGISASSVTPADCAQVLGSDRCTFSRIRRDPAYAVSGSFVAQALLTFGADAIPQLFEARLPLAA